MQVLKREQKELSVALLTLLSSDWIMVSISPVDFCVFCASVRTSSATTAKPRPCSPARAASMAALSANKLVWSAIPLITTRILTISAVPSCTSSISVFELSIASERFFICSIISLMLDVLIFFPLDLKRMAVKYFYSLIHHYHHFDDDDGCFLFDYFGSFFFQILN